MKIQAHLRHTVTGETRVCETEYVDDADVDYCGIIYHWTDGNYGCDCNRSLFFYHCDLNDDRELECNSGANVIALDRLVHVETGEVIWQA